MIKRTYDFTPDICPSAAQYIPSGSTIFFDIETTGFSSAASHLYMIGCGYRKNGRWKAVQWFDDTKTAHGECEILTAFSDFLKGFTDCISYNGQTFDFPYLRKKYEALSLENPLCGLRHLDLYRALTPYRKWFGLESLKQKNAERFLGIRKADPYSGRELIHVYDTYIKLRHWENEAGKEQLDALLLHNYEDIKGMACLLPMLSYLDFFNGRLEIRETDDAAGKSIRILAGLDSAVPVPVHMENTYWTVRLNGDEADFTIFTYEGALKYFYDNFRDYYYLPEEDEAVHKSIAAFVDKAHRIKADKKNCYTKRKGLYLPQPSAALTPLFRSDYMSEPSYLDWNDLKGDPDKLKAYIGHLISEGF